MIDVPYVKLYKPLQLIIPIRIFKPEIFRLFLEVSPLNLLLLNVKGEQDETLVPFVDYHTYYIAFIRVCIQYPEHVFIVKALSQNYVQSCTNHVNTPNALFLIKNPNK